MLALELNIAPEDWRVFNGRKTDERFQRFEQKVFERDQYTCQFCGFQAQEHQEVVNADGDYRNNHISNLVTACVFCTQCSFLDAAGVLYGGGKLIYMPDMTQAELNSLCHVLFCAMMNRTAYLNSAQNIYRNFRLLSQHIEKKFGVNTSTPNNFCRLILNQPSIDRKQLQTFLKDIRLLPSYAKFKTQLSDWARAAADELAEEVS